MTDDIADSLPGDRGAAGALALYARIFSKATAARCRPGDRLVQSGPRPNAAKRSPRTARSAFYQGPIAQKIAAAVQAAGGVMTADDLKDYRAIERAPVHGTYRGYDIVSMPPPSSGGVVLLEMLNILEGYDSRMTTKLRRSTSWSRR